MVKLTDKIKSLTETFPQLSDVEAKQLLELHGSVEDASTAVIEDESKWSKVKVPTAKTEKKDKVPKHKTPAAIAAAASQQASPRGDRPAREQRPPRTDAPKKFDEEKPKKLAPKVEPTLKIDITASKVANGVSFLDMLKKKKEVAAAAPAVAAAAPAAAPAVAAAQEAADTAAPATTTTGKRGDKKKVEKAPAAPIDEEAHNPTQDPPATQAAASSEAAPAAEEPKKERVKKPKAPKPAKVEIQYYVPNVEGCEVVTFPDHILAHPIDESVKFSSLAGEAPAPPAPAHVAPEHHVSHHLGMPQQQQAPRAPYAYPHNPQANYGNSRMNSSNPPRHHLSQWQQPGQQQQWQPSGMQPQRYGQPRGGYNSGVPRQYNDYNATATAGWGN